jgi:hypothetical protein
MKARDAMGWCCCVSYDMKKASALEMREPVKMSIYIVDFAPVSELHEFSCFVEWRKALECLSNLLSTEIT